MHTTNNKLSLSNVGIDNTMNKTAKMLVSAPVFFRTQTLVPLAPTTDTVLKNNLTTKVQAHRIEATRRDLVHVCKR